MAHQRMFDAFLPVKVDTYMRLTRHHTSDFIERHFGSLWYLSNYDAIMSFTDKTTFPDFISKNNLGKFIPETYNTVNDVKYPCE